MRVKGWASLARRRCLKLRRAFVIRGLKVLNVHRVKGPVPVVQPHLQKLVSKSPLHHNVRRAVLVDVQGPDRQRRLIRREDQRTAVACRIVKFDSKVHPPVKLAGIQKNGAVWLVIVVEIRGYESLPALLVEQTRRVPNARYSAG